MSAYYQYNCVSPDSLQELEHIIDHGRDITYRTFRKHVNRDDFWVVCRSLGYDKNFTIGQDWSVTYHKSKLPDGRTVYYMCQSAIEYIFYKDI